MIALAVPQDPHQFLHLRPATFQKFAPSPATAGPARPAGARHRPYPAPAPALRGRDTHHADPARTRWRQDGADRGHGDRQRGADAPAPATGGDRGRHRQLRAALLQLLPFAPEDHMCRARACACAAKSRAASGPPDAAPGVPQGRRGPARGADPGLSRRSCCAAQAYLRRAVASALTRVELPETLPPLEPLRFPAGAKRWSNGLQRPWRLREALLFFASPRARCGAGPRCRTTATRRGSA